MSGEVPGYDGCACLLVSPIRVGHSRYGYGRVSTGRIAEIYPNSGGEL